MGSTAMLFATNLASGFMEAIVRLSAPTVATPAHTGLKVVTLAKALPVVAAILGTLIRMHHQTASTVSIVYR